MVESRQELGQCVNLYRAVMRPSMSEQTCKDFSTMVILSMRNKYGVVGVRRFGNTHVHLCGKYEEKDSI